MRIDDLLRQAQAAGVARLDAQRLVAHRLGTSREWVIAHGDESLAGDALAAVRAALGQRAAGVPLAYLTGQREFHGFTLAVSPAVLVPRPETEGLVDWALELAPCDGAVLDLGTGSGAIAIAIARARPDLAVTGTDASAAALAVARANAGRLGVAVEWLQGDWWAALGPVRTTDARRFALVVSNPPYIAAGDPHLAALAHEPAAALVSGADGLDAIRAIVAGAAEHLAPGGWLLFEHGRDQAEAVRALLVAAGFDAPTTRADLAGLPRCTGARRP